MRLKAITAAFLLAAPACCLAAEHAAIAAAADSVPSLPRVQPETPPASAGVAASLPDGPVDQLPGAPLSFYLYRLRGRVDTTAPAPNEPIEQMEAPKFNDQSMLHLIEASPLAAVSRSIRAERFNTDDGATNDFAICYRLNRRSSVQVIPGDPAPVKLPITSMANNMGVTLGMAVRLSRTR